MTTKKLSILSEKNVVDMLIFLREGRHKENDFTQIVSNYYSINATLSKLVESGLINMNLECGRYQTRWYELTPLGEEVSAHLIIAKELIDSKNG